MTKKEIALINKVINEFHADLKRDAEGKSMFPLSEKERIDYEARMDALAWVLVATGHADVLEPSLNPEEFEETSPFSSSNRVI